MSIEGLDQDELSQFIAVVGIAARFPGAATVDEFWTNLRSGVESVRFFSDEELARAGVDRSRMPNAERYVPAQAVLDDADCFDAAFFGINRREAELMDPQHRLFLETCWSALEHAGYDPEAYKGSIAVFGGCNKNSYFYNNVFPHLGRMEPVGVPLAELVNEKDYLTTRVSHKLNLRGPSVSVHTACSTSLVAVYQAYQSLLNYQCDIALAGGVCVRVPQETGYMYQETSILSPDGHCRPYDADARGTVGGSGVGVVVLKRLDEAIADGDHVHAVIRGMAMNNDGAGKLSFSAPSMDGQAEVIAMAQAIAGVDPATIGYVEGHGTGTPLGDPIEVAALTQAFRRGTTQKGYCALGSVKSNFGHLDAAAGVAGFIKAVLTLEHGQIPPTLHFRKPNPRLEIEDSPFFIADRLVDWKSNGTPRRAAVSSFGIGGTNVHAVLEEAPRPAESATLSGAQLIRLSARSAEALERATGRLAAYLRDNRHLNLADVAFTLAVGRRSFEHRRFFVCDDIDDAIGCLADPSPERVHTGLASSNAGVTFLCAGDAGEVFDTRELCADEPTFRDAIESCRAIFRVQGIDIDSADSILARSAALFALQYAAARVLMSWGVAPDAFIGQGVGEAVAAALAGCLTLEDACRLAVHRARLLEENADPASFGVTRAALERELGIRFQAPTTRCLTAASTRWIDSAADLDAARWLDAPGNAPANLERAMGSALGDRGLVVVPGGGGSVAAALRAMASEERRILVALSDEGASRRALLTTLGRIWQSGVTIDASAPYAGLGRRRVPLPTYPFERTRYWIDPPAPDGDVRRLEEVPEAASHQALDVGDAGAVVVAPEQLLGETVMTNLPDPAPAVDRRERIRDELRTIVSEWSGLDRDEIVDDATFLELGFDSLLLTQVNGELQKRFPVSITFRQLMEEAATVSALADYIDSQLPPESPTERRAAPALPAVAVATTAPRMAVAVSTIADIPGVDELDGSSGSIEWIIDQQLRIMARQLEILGVTPSQNGQGSAGHGDPSIGIVASGSSGGTAR